MESDLSPDWKAQAYQKFMEAIEIAGGQTAMANICRCTQSNISQLIKNGSALSSRFVLRVEAATGVSRHHLRPDIYPADMPLPVAGEPAIECGEILSRYPMAGQSNKPLNLHNGSARSVRAA